MARPVSKAATTDFGREIDAICARRGWTLSDFARHAGIEGGGSQVSRYRGGKPRPTLERLAAWDGRPEIAPEMPRLRAAVQRDIERAAQARTARARARLLPAPSARPKHIADALERIERALTHAEPGPWIGAAVEIFEMQARAHPLSARAGG